MKNIIIISVSFILCNCVSNLYADTVYFEGGSEEKGIVVEKYHDRIILNTIDGEKDIQRSEIKDILYDRKEENLVKLGDFHQRKGNQKRAYQYYKKAYELNPEFKEAKDKFIHLRSVILRTPEKQLQDSMSRKQALFKHSGKVYDPSTTKKVPSTQEENFKAATGLILTMDKELPIVESVGNASAAEEAGLVTGDQIVAIWGKMAGYLDLTTMIEMIMENPSAEIIFTIKRKITIAGMEKVTIA
ncbi:MAG: hypothetical protein HQ572_01925 [Candidatus Omnitrophica bacterium]|nr:hypothetical protein [Candidatus Omnitrophota bacterium]